MAGEPSLPEKVERIHEALARARVAHAFGGALALAYYGEPRVTVDVDVNLFVGVEGAGVALSALGSIGVDTANDAAELERDGQVRLWWGRNPVDLFFAYDPFHDAMRIAVRTVPFGEGTIPVLAPEHLIVCKAAFDRPKDWIDIEQMMIGEAVIDYTEIDRWLPAVLGDSDPRVERVAELRRDSR